MYATATIVQQPSISSANRHYVQNTALATAAVIAVTPAPIPSSSSSSSVQSHHPPSRPQQQQQQQPPSQPQSLPSRQQPPSTRQEKISVVGIPSVSIQDNRLCVGDSQSKSLREYTPLKVLGDGSFGTVWLCDWHGTLPPNTPLSPMQCGAGARPEWAGKRLVAVKRMKKKWEGGWDECKRLKELESLRAIPFHPNIIPLYDFFLLPDSKELYFVFESMEGNLYHLIRARKGRPLAGGLVAAVFRQMCTGLAHIHKHGYFHRDMKPENVLVTTIGLHDYQSLSPLAAPNAPPEKDVVAIIKLADFGLARETKSKPPYTEYVSTRWYRAPEVLLLSRDYSNPVDMWAVGTIMAELVNLRPLFPGQTQLDQVHRIIQVLGDPVESYGHDARGAPIGGGVWQRGVTLGEKVGFAFPKASPKDFKSLFEPSIPPTLIECIADLLRYDPEARLTSQQCLDHPYLVQMLPKNTIPMLNAITVQVAPNTPRQHHNVPSSPLPSPRPVPPSHSHAGTSAQSPILSSPILSNAEASSSSGHRSPYFSQRIALTPSPSGSRAADYISHLRIHDDGLSSPPPVPPLPPGAASWNAANKSAHGQQGRKWDTALPPNGYGEPMDVVSSSSPGMSDQPNRIESDGANAGASHGKLGKLSLPFGKKSSKWGLGMFSASNEKPPPLPQHDDLPASSTADVLNGQTDITVPLDSKQAKKEAERIKREADRERHALAEERHREQARAVLQKRTQMGQNDLEFKWLGYENAVNHKNDPGLHSRNRNGAHTGPRVAPNTISAAAGRYGPPSVATAGAGWRSEERYAKARRRDLDDDHSMSSSDLASVSRLSVMSFATVDTSKSDPTDPSSMYRRRDHYGSMARSTTSSANTSTDDYSRRSSYSLSVENQLVNDFSRANVNSVHRNLTRRASRPNFISMPSPAIFHENEYHEDPNDTTPDRQFSPTLGRTPVHPIFKVPATSPDAEHKLILPPCSQLTAVAEGDFPPLSPMSFNSPENTEFS